MSQHPSSGNGRPPVDPQFHNDYATTVTILEHLADAVFILDAQGRIQYANQVALDLLDVDLLTLVEQPLAACMRLDGDMPDPDGFLETVFRSPSSEMEARLVLGERSVPVVAGFGAIRNDRNELQYVLVSAKDLSTRQQLRAEEQQREELAISRDRVKALGSLAMGLVHELSQPLATLKLNLELVQKRLGGSEPPLAELAGELAAMGSLIDTMGGIIENARTFALEVEDDSLKLVDVRRCIDRAIGHLNYELLERNIRIRLELPPSLPLMSANPVTMEQVFVTLVKYLWSPLVIAEARFHDIVIHGASHEDRWMRIALSVADSEGTDDAAAGDPGIDLSLQLELSAVRSIVTGLGGDIRIHGSAGNPREVVLRLPADSASERDQLGNLIEMLHQDPEDAWTRR